MHRPPGVKVLSGNNGSQNKKIGDGGDGSATYSGFPADRLNDEFRGYCRVIDRRYQNRDWDPLSQWGSNPFYPVIRQSRILFGQNCN
jgi:hypothetical protein